MPLLLQPTVHSLLLQAMIRRSEYGVLLMGVRKRSCLVTDLLFIQLLSVLTADQLLLAALIKLFVFGKFQSQMKRSMRNVFRMNTGDTAILKGHSDSVFCVAYNADGSLLTSCGRDKRIIVWSVCDGAARSSITLLYTYLRSAAFNPHGTLLAAGCGDSRVMLAALPPSDEDGTATPDVPTATTAAAEGAGDPVSAHTASKAAGSPACGASQPPAPSSSPEASARSPFTGHRGAVMSVAWSGDGQWIASGAGDGTAMLWCARTGRLAAAPAVHGSPVLCVAFSAVGSLLAAADDGGNVILWDLAGPERRLAVAMATHSRLGARSSLGGLEPELLARIAAALPVWAPP